MPKLITSTIKRLELPSTKDAPEEEKAWVEVKDRLTGGDWNAARSGKTDGERTDAGIAMFIVNWNFTDAEGKVDPITAETVHRLELEDYNFLSEQLYAASKDVITSLQEDQKKTLSSISTPSVPGVNPT